MPLAPLAELEPVLRSLSAQAFSDHHATEDVVVVEPYEKTWDYRGQTFHAGASYIFVPKVPGEPVPVGRDARASVQIDHAAVSRLHVVLAFSPAGWQTMDRSSNGSWLDGERLDRDQAVSIPYGAPLRLGRAVVIRLLRPDAFYSAAANASGFPRAPAPMTNAPPADPGSSTWRFPSMRDSGRLAPAPLPPQPPVRRAPATPSPDVEIELDFDFGDMGDHPLTAPNRAPPPMSPPPSRRGPSSADEDIEFDIDFDDDNRGGFA